MVPIGILISIRQPRHLNESVMISSGFTEGVQKLTDEPNR